jgi:hypothetical protein
MKKILIIATAFLVLLAILPVVGNKVLDSQLNSHIQVLSSKGLDLKKVQTHSNYLFTKKHYEFVLKDAQGLSEYMKELLKDSVIGADVEFSNIPISGTVSIDLYPISLSKETMEKVREDDAEFAAYLEDIFKRKAIFYHIDYKVSSQEFSGYVKDIKESHTFLGGQKLDVQMRSSSFKGEGPIIEPNYIDAQTKNIDIKVVNKSDSMSVKIEDISLSSETIDIQRFELHIEDLKTGQTKLSIDNIASAFSSNMKGKKAEFTSKLSLAKLKLSSFKERVELDGFRYDIALKDIDKDAYAELEKLTSDLKNIDDYRYSEKLQKITEKIMRRGFTLNLDELAFDNIKVSDKDLSSTSLKAKVHLKEGSELEKLEMDMLFKISKPLFGVVVSANPIVGLSQGFAKEQNNSFVYDIKLKDESLYVNGKRIK